MERIKIAIVGATGMVGRMFLRVLEERRIDADYTLFASAKSAGSKLQFFESEYTVRELTEDCFEGQGSGMRCFRQVDPSANALRRLQRKQAQS